MIKCSSRQGLLTRLLVFQPAYGCSPFIRGFALFSARDSLPRPGNPLRPSRMNDSALWPRWIFNEIDDVSIGIRLFAFPSARGFALSSARYSLPRPVNPLWPRRMMIKCSSGDGLLTRLLVFQTAYDCSPFPPSEGSLSSLPEILSPARGIRSGRDG